MGASFCCISKRQSMSNSMTPTGGAEEMKCLAQCLPSSRFTKTEDQLINDGLICAICLNVVRNAVKDPCGHVYGEECILNWLAQTQKCPFSQKVLKPSDLQPDFAVRLRVQNEQSNLKSSLYLQTIEIEVQVGKAC